MPLDRNAFSDTNDFDAPESTNALNSTESLSLTVVKNAGQLGVLLIEHRMEERDPACDDDDEVSPTVATCDRQAVAQ